MVTKKDERFTVIDSGNAGAWRDGRSANTKSLVLLTVVLVALIGSGGAFFVLSDGSASGERLSVSAPAQDNATAVPYFPSQYVNQAKEIEPQPPTF